MNDGASQPAHIPRATYRLQLTPEFGFTKARELVPYLHQLGISDIYCSPILTARSGSTHGYDVIDPLHISSELGGHEEFERLVHETKRHDMSLLIDIVPNHMAASIDNPWWYDVLENGPSSRYAHFFDIEWIPADPNESLRNRVLLPILGAPYGETLENGEIQLVATDDGYGLRYYEHLLPLSIESYPPILRISASEIRPILENENAGWPDFQQLLGTISRMPRSDHFDAAIARRRRRLRHRIGNELMRLRAIPAVAQAFDRGIAEINGTPGDARSYDRLDRIVRMQAYRLAFWQIAREQINYRRFFDINDLVSLRVEDDDVFDTTHQLILDLVRTGMVSGLRIDHIDGLRDPERYLRKLRTRLDRLAAGPQRSTYLVVEKILAFDEPLPNEWPVSGTTGYDALNLIGDLFIDPARMTEREAIYRRMSGVTESYAEIVYQAKRELQESTFTTYVRSLTFGLEAVSNSDRHGRDLTFGSLQQALIETTAALPVYRTYINDLTVHDRDRQWIEHAIGLARSRRPDLRHTLDFLARVFTLDIPGYVPSSRHHDWLDVVMRWQQLCGPVMAKGNEDTALYRFFPLSSRNEVGGHPDRPPESIREAHTHAEMIAERWPHTMIATSTHDTKRSEDVRARIAVLSEMPDEWGERLAHWQLLNTDKRATRDAIAIPDGNVEYLIYQTMLGAWPFDQNEIDAFHQRLNDYVIKAVREAKVHSSWVEPDTVYEDALLSFIDSLFGTSDSSPFLSDFTAFQKRIARVGALNSLSQTLIKLTAPGIPDIYQGSDLWNLSLVDPDNRRPVDYLHRAQALARLDGADSDTQLLHDLTTNWQEGQIKLFLIQHVLHLRRSLSSLFANRNYTPIIASGEREEHVFSYVRTHKTGDLLIVAPRLCSSIIDEGDELTASRKWGNSTLSLPSDWHGQAHDLISGETTPVVNVHGTRSVMLSEVLRYFPVGLLGDERIVETLNSA